MAIIPLILSAISKRIGQLLRAVFGWSITGLFGRIPQGKQTALSAALVMAIVWPMLVVGSFVPAVAAWGLAFLPLQRWLGDTVLRVIWIALAVTVPLAVGAIVRWVSPSDARKGGPLATILGGYPLTLGFFLSFMITLFVVPALKLAALLKGKADEHVYVQPYRGHYGDVLNVLARSCNDAGVDVVEERMPRPMELPTKVIKWFARGGLDPVVADNPRMLRGHDVELYLYPADLLLRGKPRTVAKVRAAMTRSFLRAPAHLTEDPHAQSMELEVDRMWEVVDRHEHSEELGAGARMRVRELTHKLDRLEIPHDDWVLLYTELHHLERAVMGAPTLVDEKVAPQHQPWEVAQMRHQYETTEASTASLVKEAIDEAKDLVRAEVALAKNEVQREVAQAKRSAIAFGVAGLCAVLALATLLVALGLAIELRALPVALIGVVLLVGAGVAGFLGYKALPEKPLHETKERVETDINILKEQTA